MKPFERCPICGGELGDKQVEKLLRGGGNTVSMKVAAEVCLHCGERLYSEEVVKSFEEIRTKLRKQEFSHFKTPALAEDVIRDYVECYDWQLAEIGKAIKEADAQDFASEKEVQNFRGKWGLDEG